MPHTEIEITAELVRNLLRDQHPDLADRPLRLGARGWGNQLWRLGDDLAVRLPWATQSADGLLRKEHAWLPALAPHLPLQVPVPQRLGEPSERFPRPWIVTTWVPGVPADRVPVTRAADAADCLAGFLTALHRPAPDGAPVGRGRGGPLADAAEHFAQGFASATELGLLSDPEAVRAVWEDAVAAPQWEGPALWIHGDLHPANVLTADGTFCGVIDFGDLCAGDPLDGIGPRLRTLRRERGLTLEALAKDTGISVSTLSRLESGRRRPTLDLLIPLAREHRVALDQLVAAGSTGDPRVHLQPQPGTRQRSRTAYAVPGPRAGLQAGPRPPRTEARHPLRLRMAVRARG
jgi:aminoglycoside phosphotransferase (APT) family kinase protein